MREAPLKYSRNIIHGQSAQTSTGACMFTPLAMQKPDMIWSTLGKSRLQKRSRLTSRLTKMYSPPGFSFVSSVRMRSPDCLDRPIKLEGRCCSARISQWYSLASSQYIASMHSHPSGLITQAHTTRLPLSGFIFLFVAEFLPVKRLSSFALRGLCHQPRLL